MPSRCLRTGGRRGLYPIPVAERNRHLWQARRVDKRAMMPDPTWPMGRLHFRHASRIRLTAALALLALAPGCQQPAPLPVGADRFERLGNDGRALAAADARPHACVFDRVTGLTWAITPAADGPQTYSWFSSDPAVHVSDPGLQHGGQCRPGRCDTEALAAAYNGARHCGYADWRLPQRDEALTLAARAPAGHEHVLDPEFFPDTVAGEYWTAETFRMYPQSAWAFDTRTGLDRADWKRQAKPARPVRGTFERHSLRRHGR
ncbi:MAG: DUF1566 domain-containing protein [Gammaproteobacteria bacterium]|nr:DUF1566 domain-containing protein [Gammaproteobacteria bacterium]